MVDSRTLSLKLDDRSDVSADSVAVRDLEKLLLSIKRPDQSGLLRDGFVVSRENKR